MGRYYFAGCFASRLMVDASGVMFFGTPEKLTVWCIIAFLDPPIRRFLLSATV